MKAILRLVIVAAITSVSSHTSAQWWHNLGNPGFSDGSAQYITLAVDNNDVNYVAYTDGANGDKATVKKYDGKNWIDVGAPGFSPGAAYATYLAIDKAGDPHVAFQDQGNNNKATVMKYNGISWISVGGYGVSQGAVHQTSIAFDSSGNLFLAYRDSANGGKATVMKYDGASWATVGAAGFSSVPISELSIAINSIGTPYVYFTDLSAGNTGIVMLYNGTYWTTVAYPPTPITGADIANITFGKNDTPYVAYCYRHIYEPNDSYVKKLVNNRWELVYHFWGNDICSLAMDTSATPCIVFADTLGKLCVEKSGGGNWNTPWQKIGKPGFSPGKANFITMAINKKNVPIVAFQDEAHGNKASVMIFDCFPDAPLDICAAIVDTSNSDRITLVWDRGTLAEFADSLYIYREDNGAYVKLRTLPLISYPFVDTAVNPASEAYRYKLTYINKCGIEAPISPGSIHRTIKLDFMYRSNEFALLKWNSYEGISDPTYKIMRSNNNGPFVPIAKLNISGNDTTYIDNNQPAGENRYRIDIELDNICLHYYTQFYYLSYPRITSNTVTSWNSGVAKITDENKIIIAPNPVSNELRIMSGEKITRVEIIDITGRTLIAENGGGHTELLLNVNKLLPGIYSLRLNGTHNERFVKL